MSIRALPLLCLLAAPAADADTIELVPTCVAIDGSHDALTSLERAQAQTILTHVLEEQDLLVVETGCSDTYTLAHEREGQQLIVHLHGPRGSRRLHVAGFSELPGAYRRMVKSLREAPPSGAGPASATTPAAPAVAPALADAPPAYAPPLDVVEPLPAPAITQLAEEPIPHTSGTLYAQLGVGAMANADSPHSFGLGYRHETEGVVIDGSLTGFASDSAGTQSVTGVRLAGRLLRELTPASASSLYAGGGLALGNASIIASSVTYTGGGGEAIGTVGADFRRDRSGVRVFAQADIVLPLYSLSPASGGGSEYAPSFLLSLGLGL